MKTTILTFIFATVVLFSFGQKNLQSKSSIELISEGYDAYEEEKFDESIEVLKKISVNDTNYVIAQKQLAQAYIKVEKFAEAVELLEKLLKYESAYDGRATIYSTLGVAYIGLDEFDKSIEVLNKGISEYPKSQYLYFAKAKTYEKHEDFQEALDNYKLSAQASITHHAAHVQLGIYAAREGNFAEAMMSFMTCILIEPKGDQAASIISFMEEIANGSYSPEPKGIVLSKSGDDFEDLNLLFVNKIALQAKYKTKFSIPTAYAKQFHLISSTISYSKADEGFWNQTYVALYQDIFKAGMLDPMIVFSLQSVDNKDTQKKVSSKKGLIDKFLKEATPIWTRSIQKQYAEFEGEMQHIFVINQSGTRLYGVIDEKNNSMVGNWYGYFSEGNLQLETELDSKGEKNGVFKKYDFFTRNLIEYAEYKNNVLNGEQRFYYSSGELEQKRTNLDGKLVDTVYNYYRGGQIEDKIAVGNDMRDGQSATFYENGKLHTVTDYKEGQINGGYKSYFTNGLVQTEVLVTDGKVEGIKKGFYPDGQLQYEQNYKNDLLDGAFKTFHANGKLEEEGSHLNGDIVGQVKEYYSNGLIYSNAQYDENGKKNGIVENFDSEGKKYMAFTFKKGNMEKIELFDKTGAIIKTISKSGKKLQYENYYPTRNLYCEGEYVDGIAEGVWKYYDDYGVLNKVEKYKAGLIQDTVKAYYPNGKIDYISAYKEGKRDGIYLKYNVFGVLTQEGRYRKCEPVNDWYSYYSDGSLEEEYAFKNGIRHGYQNNYSVNGKLSSYEIYSDGIIISTVYLDTNGVERGSFGQMNGKIELSDPSNSYTRFFGYYNSGEIEGITKWYDAEKNLITEGENVNGEREGLWKYYDNAKLYKTIEYKNGEKHGESIEFHPNGKKRSVVKYLYGSLQGLTTYYFANGNKESEFNYLDDKRHGRMVTYGTDGSVQQFRYYDRGVLLSYSYLDKTGKEIEPIPVKKEESSFTVYYQSGKKAVEQVRVQGLIHGKYVEYYPNGTVYVEGSYYYGDLQGTYITYHPNGKKKQEGVYVNDDYEGLVTIYYESGKVKETIEYRVGVQHGEHKMYAEDGKLTKTYVYYDGEMVKAF